MQVVEVPKLYRRLRSFITATCCMNCLGLQGRALREMCRVLSSVGRGIGFVTSLVSRSTIGYCCSDMLFSSPKVIGGEAAMTAQPF
jgi:hypothetical protein